MTSSQPQTAPRLLSDRSLLTVAQVAERLNIGRTHAYELCNRNGLPSVRIGSSVRVHPDALDAFVDAGGER